MTWTVICRWRWQPYFFLANFYPKQGISSGYVMDDFFCMGLIYLWGAPTEKYKMKILAQSEIRTRDLSLTGQKSISVALLDPHRRKRNRAWVSDDARSDMICLRYKRWYLHWHPKLLQWFRITPWEGPRFSWQFQIGYVESPSYGFLLSCNVYKDLGRFYVLKCPA